MKRWALLIGISDYYERGLVSSDLAIANVKAFDQFLQQAGYTTICLHDEPGVTTTQQPTRRNILKSLKELQEKSKPEDVVIVYFAGVGLNKTETLSLLVKDSKSENDSITLEQLGRSVRESRTSNWLFVIEMMQSGMDFPILMQPSKKLTPTFLVTGTNIQASQERSRTEKTTSVFLDDLLAGLSGRADQKQKGQVTIKDIGQFWTSPLPDEQIGVKGSFNSPFFYLNKALSDVVLIDFNILSVKRNQHRALCFTERAIQLDLMLIPGGTFMMGSPADEIDRSDAEGPQHEVTIAPFLMGRYPITQAQWRAIAQREDLKVNADLDPDPSHFKGETHPVEQVSWYDAVEFCDRLSRLTGHTYRLPTEAEWEYACRAGTTTPFHFGETITTDLANYRGTDDDTFNWSGSYGKGPKGIYRQTTTPVNEFAIANAFGLCDMHGNVWEWCQDHWHENYEGAPVDGSAWLTNNDNTGRVFRGGSWYYNPRPCRSAYRLRTLPDNRYSNDGFRVVCVAPRTL